MKISSFLNDVYSASALYINYRNTPSYIDGLKNSSRKCLYTLKKRKPSSEVKVSNFAGAVIDESKYIHGNASLETVIVNMSSNFCGSNNVPVMEGVGAFGTRFVNESAAPRYIFIKPTDYMDAIYKKADDQNLVEQEFEGDSIEPVFYVPTIPMLLVNGSEGIGVGFAQTILQRSVKNVFTMVRNKIEKKKLSEKLFVPSWHGFKGEVKSAGDLKWEIRGCLEVDEKDWHKVTITELPITYSLRKYLDLLKKLKETGVIYKYIDYSEDDNFKFEVKFDPLAKEMTKEQMMNTLGLVDTITENLTVIDENNAIKDEKNFKSVQEIFEAYYKIKIKYLKKRIVSETKRLQEELDYLNEVYEFIMDVNKGNINVKLKKADVEKKMKELEYKYVDRLIALPIYSLTKDKAAEAKQKAADKKAELEEMKKETPEDIWLKDLDELETKLKKDGLYV